MARQAKPIFLSNKIEIYQFDQLNCFSIQWVYLKRQLVLLGDQVPKIKAFSVRKF